ncbi:MAG TPA: thioredoxin domain-containing protein [Pyrinomonadaceae bacterium]|nr:thioredoxin domain-containing protein [Pyrinomonadaceae bacterium]
MKKEVGILLAIGVVVVVLGVVGASYYRGSVQKAPVVPDNSKVLVRPDSYTLGPADAKVTIVEFLDPECESCASVAPQVKALLKEYDGKSVRLVARYMPLHPNAKLAVQYTEAAGAQGKYWEYQEKLFAMQSEWGTKHGPAGAHAAPTAPISTLFEKYGKEIGLDPQKLNADAGNSDYTQKADRDLNDGRALGVRATPTFFVNGRKLARLSMQDLRTLINEELAK